MPYATASWHSACMHAGEHHLVHLITWTTVWEEMIQHPSWMLDCWAVGVWIWCVGEVGVCTGYCECLKMTYMWCCSCSCAGRDARLRTSTRRRRTAQCSTTLTVCPSSLLSTLFCPSSTSKHHCLSTCPPISIIAQISYLTEQAVVSLLSIHNPPRVILVSILTHIHNSLVLLFKWSHQDLRSHKMMSLLLFLCESRTSR